MTPSTPILKVIPLAATLALLGGIGWEAGARPRPEDAAPYHLAVRDFFESVPYRIGSWTGTDNPDTPEARKLLKPNVMFSRTYIQAGTGVSANLLFVQCRDSRDMTGHYPPNCYPANGWNRDFDLSQDRVRVGDLDIPMARYAFERVGMTRRLRAVVYQFFVLPRRGFATGMDSVVRTASDYRVRAMGAAQVQVVMGSGLSPDQERAVVRELIEPLTPVLKVLSSGAARRETREVTP